MSATWEGGPPPPPVALTPGRIASVVLRGIPLTLLVFGGLVVLLLVRLVERPIFGTKRPVTPYITVFVCKGALFLLGLHLSVKGEPMEGDGAIVANHSSWLDIFFLNAVKRVYFVSKSEVAGWPGIGWLARATGTVFIARDRSQAAEQTKLFRERLLAGHKLLFFPEGTSSDGARVLPFKPTLFAAFFDLDLRDRLWVQPVSVIYVAPAGQDPKFFGWWGDMDFGSHLLKVLAAGQGGRIKLIYHPPLPPSNIKDRKALARACEQAIREGFETVRK